MLDHLIHKGWSLYQSFLGLIDIEHTENTGPVYLGAQDVNQVDDVFQQVHLIVCGGRSGAFPSPGGKVCFVEHRKGAYFSETQ